jgi:GR25 family glycosyltransferase involved in LPS biosynthesis
MEIGKFYVINLEHRHDRRDTAVKHFQSAGINNYEFVKAVHYKDFTDEFANDLVNRKYKWKTTDEISKRGLLACGMSHIKAIEQALDELGDDGSKVIVILEDDFHIVDETTFMIRLHEGLRNAPNDWEFMYLGGPGRDSVDKTTPFIPGLDKGTNVWASHAYVIKNNRDFLNRLKECYKEGYFADRAFRKIIRENKDYSHRFLIYKPYLAVQWKSYSDIDRRMFGLSNVKNKFEN